MTGDFELSEDDDGAAGDLRHLHIAGNEAGVHIPDLTEVRGRKFHKFCHDATALYAVTHENTQLLYSPAA